MLKKLLSIILTSTMVGLLAMPFVSAWATSASTTLNPPNVMATSGEVGLSKKALYTGENTSTNPIAGTVYIEAYAAYYSSLYTKEASFPLERKGNKVQHTETQDIDSKYKVRVRSSGYCRENGKGTVKIL